LLDISDHLPNYTLILNEKKQYNPVKPIIKTFSDENENRFHEKLPSSNWDAVSCQNDANDAYDTFIDIVINAFKRVFRK